MLCLTLGNEALALLGYFVSAYAYQCYYQVKNKNNQIIIIIILKFRQELSMQLKVH